MSNHPYRPLPVIKEVDGKPYIFDTPGACPTCRWSYGGSAFRKCKLNLRGLECCNTINKNANCEKWHPKPLAKERAKKFILTALATYGLVDLLLWIFF